MSASITRPRPFAEHPVVRKKYVIPTPSIDTLYQRVLGSIKYGRAGELVWGMTRFGKTSAIRYIRSCLAVDHPRLVTVKMLCQKSKSRSENAFFSHFLRCADHAQATSGTIAKKRERLQEKLLERVERSNQHMILFFLDEAQRLDVLEYEWVRDVYDELEEAGVRVFVYSVGQPELLNKKTAFRESHNMQIVGRFMTREHAFHGLTSVDDVATCLAGYDGNYYPDRSDWTYPRFFLPKAWDGGLRMVDTAADLWQAFAEAHMGAGFAAELEIPMKYFSLAVEIALISNVEQDDEDFRLTPALWTRAVEESDYVSAQQSVTLRVSDADLDAA